MRPTAAAALLLAVLPVAVPAAMAVESPVAAEAFVSAAAVRPGDSFRIAVHLSIDGRWHVQANVPSEEHYIATRLELDPTAGLTADPLRYPPGERLEAPALGGTLLVYSDGVILGGTVRVAPDAAPGPRVLGGRLTYQACDERTCLFPRTVDLQFPVAVDPQAPSPPPLQEPAIFAALEALQAAEPPAPPAGGIGDEIEERGFSLWLLGVFVLGLALNLTPCVYPVIAVTLSYFGRQGPGGVGRIARATAYATGIGLTFTSLFLVAGTTGQLFGSWLQNRWVLAGLAAVLVALGLANFGLFELQAPAWLRNRAAGGRAGLLGALVMGLAMGVVAAPCVGPLLAGLLIWVGQQGDVVQAGAVGATLSAGLALPYLALGVFSSSLARLPRSGDWMEWVKHAMGFLLFGVALYFLTPFLPARWFLPSFAFLALVAAVWLVGLDRAGWESRAVWFLRGAVLASAVVAAVLLLRLAETEGIAWEPYSPAAVEDATAEGMPAMIDFTADWCVPCKVMEHGAFKDPEVVEASLRFRRLRVDLTRPEGPAAAAVERYQVAGPPTIVFVGSSGAEARDLRVIESVSGRELLERMRRATGDR